MDRETARQIFHMAVGLCAVALLLTLGRGAMIVATFLIIIIGLLLINLRLLGFKIPIVRWFEERFERSDAPGASGEPLVEDLALPPAERGRFEAHRREDRHHGARAGAAGRPIDFSVCEDRHVPEIGST